MDLANYYGRSLEDFRAIILAAGRNARLNEITNLPKTLLKVGRECFLDRIVLSCKTCGINRIVIVVGYESEKIDTYIEEHPKIFGDLVVKTIYNSDYDVANNIVSFWLARDEMDRSFILFNSDVLFHSKVLEILLKSNVSSGLAIDDSKVLGAEEMKVLMNNNRLIVDISKSIDPLMSEGEYIGIAKFFDQRIINKLLPKCRLLIDFGKTDVFYEEAFRLLSIEEPCIHGVSTKGLPWIEVDTPEDYERAKKEVYSKIASAKLGN